VGKNPRNLGKAFASSMSTLVSKPDSSLVPGPANPGPSQRADCYSPREIAVAAGVPEQQVVAALGGTRRYVLREEAVRLGRALHQLHRSEGSVFAMFVNGPKARPAGLPLAISSTLHAGVFAAALFLTTAGLTPAAATAVNTRFDSIPLVFVALPGPGGGGGGGGLQQKPPPPKAEREGRRAISSPLPLRRPPKPIEPVPAPPEPRPEPLKAEHLPIVVAPIIAMPADARSRSGILEQTTAENDSRGSGTGGGAGSGSGTGIGEGEGTGVGRGSGGGTGGGVYRPGSGIEPPKLLHEVKPDYTEDARVRRLEGEVVMEIVVRRDGSVGDVRILRGLGGGLNERAVQAVRQWRFSPARRLGSPVDVLVEVSVEFKVR
jgi:periplasmic protein TonB